MEFYDKFVDRFQDISQVKNPAVSKAKVWQLPIVRAFKRNCFKACFHIDHASCESSSGNGFTKFSNHFFRCSYCVLEIYVLNKH